MRCPEESVDVASLGLQFCTFSGVGVPSVAVTRFRTAVVEDRALCCSVLDYAVALCSLQCIIEAVEFCRHCRSIRRPAVCVGSACSGNEQCDTRKCRQVLEKT